MTRRATAGLCVVAVATGLLASCGGPGRDNADRGPTNATIVESGQPISAPKGVAGTPMAERVAVIGLLNKRNGITRDLTMKPGQAMRVGPAVVRLRACEQTAPWEDPPETGAFVQLDVQETRDNKWYRVFSGWVFKNRPERNVVQHPIYDVWVKSCAMTWPETGPDTVKLSGGGKASGARGGGGAEASDTGTPVSGSASSAPQSPAQTPGRPGTAPATAAPSSPE